MTNYVGSLIGSGIYDMYLVPILILAVYLGLDFYIERVLGKPSTPVLLGWLFAIPAWLLSLPSRFRRVAPRPVVQPPQAHEVVDAISSGPGDVPAPPERNKFKRAR